MRKVRVTRSVRRFSYASLGYGIRREAARLRTGTGIKTLKVVLCIFSGSYRVAGRIIERFSQS